VTAHEEDHVGDRADRDHADDGLEGLLLALGKELVDELEHDRDADTESDGERDAQPHPA
jgi:hypothetical protein